MIKNKMFIHIQIIKSWLNVSHPGMFGSFWSIVSEAHLSLLIYSSGISKGHVSKILYISPELWSGGARSVLWCCTFSFIMESWHILSPLASGTSSMPISLALYLTPSPWNLPSRYSSVFSSTGKQKQEFDFSQQHDPKPRRHAASSSAHLSFSPS